MGCSDSKPEEKQTELADLAGGRHVHSSSYEEDWYQQQQQLSARRQGKLDAEQLGRVLKAAMERSIQKGCGVSALVIQKGQTVFEHAAGDLKLDALVRIASMTKPFTCVCALTLVEEGLLNLKMDLTAKWLPELKGVKVLSDNLVEEPRQGGITLKHLLSHSSGISYPFWQQDSFGASHPMSSRIGFLHRKYQNEGMWDGLPWTGEQNQRVLFEKLGKCPLLFQPGSRHMYSLGIDVAGVLIERVTGKTLFEALKERVLAPLGLEDTFFHIPAEKQHRLSTLYEPSRKDGKPPVKPRADIIDSHPHDNVYFRFHRTFPWTEGLQESGGSGLVSTLRDYGTFIQAVLAASRGDPPPKGCKPILSRTAAALLLSDVLGPVPGMDAGRGFSLMCPIVLEPGKAQELIPAGSITQGGMFATVFHANAAHDVTAVLMQQVYPMDDEDIRLIFPGIVYGALR